VLTIYFIIANQLSERIQKMFENNEKVSKFYNWFVVDFAYKQKFIMDISLNKVY
jgi:hypothetical protein